MVKNRMKVYHGTSGAAAESIRREQRFLESRKDNEWLGHGVYFFGYQRHAEFWIVNRQLKQGTVLTVQLQFTSEEILDLDNPDDFEALNQEMARLNEIIGPHIRVGPLDRKELWKLWCLGCNLYRKLHPEIGIISYTFPQSKKKVGASGFCPNEKQLCVSRHEIIVGIT